MVQGTAFAVNFGTATVSRFAEQAEWTLTNSTFFGNAFDVVARASFVHEGSGETCATEMFYDGNNQWKLRFTGTKPGIWQFTTTSADPDLDGHSGQVQVDPAPPGTKGFLIASGQKFARQTETGEPEAIPFNVYMNEHDFPSREIANWDDAKTDGFISDAAQYGFNTIFVHPNNQWFSLGDNSYAEHSSENPDLETFRILEGIIRRAHSQGAHVQIWAWGDEERKWTPPGGINRTPDRRLQRYIAARLGPLPGWSMGYGFDLREWVTEGQVESWAAFMHSRLGWPHLLWARDRSNAGLDVKSHPGFHIRSYETIVADMESDPGRPQLYEERHTSHRASSLNMTGTRRFLWDLTMAGGAGCWWGFFEWLGDQAPPYDHPEMLLTHSSFWKGRFHLDFLRDQSLGDSPALRSPDFQRFVFYKEDAGSIEIDLSSAPEPMRVIAVNALTHYEEIDLGVFSNALHIINLPSTSDWAIAVGEFTQARLPPAQVTGLIATPVSASRISLSWQPLKDPSGILEYRVYRNGSLAGCSATTNFSDTGLAAATTYTYSIRALNGAGIEGPPSEALAAATLNTTSSGRVSQGLIALYEFEEGAGNTVHDTSDFGTPLDLRIPESTAAAPLWIAGGVRLGSLGILSSEIAAIKVVDQVAARREISVEAWIRPANITQAGPARLITISQDSQERNFTLGQQSSGYQIRLRTQETTANGVPALDAGKSATVSLQHVVYTCDASGQAAFFLDGTLIGNEHVGTISNWNPGYALAVGNEFTLDRAWAGEVYLIAIYDRALPPQDILQNFDAGPNPSTVIESFTTWALGLPEGQRHESDDPDGDLLSNFIEYSLGGTPEDALNASDLTEYSSFLKAGEAFVITLKNPARPDVQYEVQRSQILNPPTWSAIARKDPGSNWQALSFESVVTSNNSGTHVSHNSGIAAGAFYRIVARNPETEEPVE